MRYRTLTLSLAALASGAILAPQAGAGVRWAAPEGFELDACMLTAAPWNETQYALDVVHADGSVDTLLEQTYGHLAPTSWTVPADIVEVRWAKHVTTGEFFDHLQVGPDCTFVNAYNATPGKPDSVVIAPIWKAVPTTTSTTPTPTSTTVEVPTPTTITVQATTPTPVIDEPLTPATVPSTIDAQVPTPVTDAPTTTVTPSVPDQLPRTGAGLEAAVLGGGTLMAGLLALVADKVVARRRRG